MIEQFTPEELDLIRKELREKDRAAQKDKLLREQFRRAVRVLDFRTDPELQDSFTAFDVKSALNLLIDHALKNYIPKERKNSTKRIWKRNCAVPAEMEKDYLAAYTRLVDVLEDVSVPWKRADE